MKSKITLFLFFFLISTTLAFGQNFKFKSTDISQIQNVVPDTIYPPASYFPSYASAWTQTTNYPNRINIFKATPLIQGGIVFIGNSITEFGKDWSARFGVNGIQNRGIAGDVTEGVLARLGEIGYFKPKAVFILIGINDIFANKTSDFVAGNILKIVNSIHARTPETKVYVQTILPNGTVKTRPVIAATNEVLKASAAANNYTVVDLHPLFADANDNIQAAYTTDGTHLTEAGYSVWIANEKPLISSVIDSEPIIKTGKINISPNPVLDKLTFTGLDNNEKYNCEIYNIEGKNVMSSNIIYKNELNVSSLAANRYFLKMYNNLNSLNLTFQFQKL